MHDWTAIGLAFCALGCIGNADPLSDAGDAGPPGETGPSCSLGPAVATKCRPHADNLRAVHTFGDIAVGTTVAATSKFYYFLGPTGTSRIRRDTLAGDGHVPACKREAVDLPVASLDPAFALFSDRICLRATTNMPAIVCLYDDARGKVEIPTDGHVFAAFTRVGNELAIVGNEVFLRKGDTWAPLPTAPLDGLHTYVGDGAITAIGQYTNVPGHPVYYRTLTSETTWVADGQATFFPGWETWQFLLPINGEREAPLWGSLGGKLVIEAVGNNRQEIGGPAAGRFGNGQGDFAVYEAASVRHFGASEVATPLRGTDVRLRFAGTGELLAYGRLDGCDGTEFVTVVR